ncbi:uncharacterized protein LOC119276890 [Triticum dicoccoides]|uniref:uncharacterized protein LOC119276890 n=1 Tax=Triticum dicoccoides TaxID=85692 RepID=UPI00188DDD83|nr:uncharacterized protein LOC119276890 [Triticum dicoccoides]XP_037413958.1 uncharacterized protein LOC119276890 [Triticum dicoccoides]
MYELEGQRRACQTPSGRRRPRRLDVARSSEGAVAARLHGCLRPLDSVIRLLPLCLDLQIPASLRRTRSRAAAHHAILPTLRRPCDEVRRRKSCPPEPSVTTASTGVPQWPSASTAPMGAPQWPSAGAGVLLRTADGGAVVRSCSANRRTSHTSARCCARRAPPTGLPCAPTVFSCLRLLAAGALASTMLDKGGLRPPSHPQLHKNTMDAAQAFARPVLQGLLGQTLRDAEGGGQFHHMARGRDLVSTACTGRPAANTTRRRRRISHDGARPETGKKQWTLTTCLLKCPWRKRGKK